MYRDPRHAADAQLQALRAEVASLGAALERAERARLEATTALEHAREGVEDDGTLDHDVRYRRAQRCLTALGVIGIGLATIGLVPLLISTFEAPLASFQGVENLVFHLRHGEGALGLAASGAAIVLASPWLVLPWIGAIGLRRQRRWGYFLGIASGVLYLATPLMPLAAYALAVLVSERVRRAYFPRSSR